MKAIITGPNEIPLRADPLIDLVDYLVTGDLTSDGIQYTEAATTGEADTDIEVMSATIEPPMDGTLVALEFGLSAMLKAVSSATADLIWKWQARNKDGTWVDLHDAVTETNIGTSFVARTRSGYFAPATNIDEVPFEVRLLLQCNEADEGQAKVKNSSYVRAIYSTA